MPSNTRTGDLRPSPGPTPSGETRSGVVPSLYTAIAGKMYATRFNGEKPEQLSQLLAQLQSMFRIRAAEFPTERSKVDYVALHLDGDPLSWADTLYAQDEPSPLLDDFSLFARELESRFGPPIHVTAERFRDLRQTESVASYAAEFRRIASRLQWNHQSLVHMFFTGLKYPMKRELCREPLPDSLDEIISRAITLDNLQQHSTRLYRATQPPGPPSRREPPARAAPAAANAAPRLTEEQKEYRRKNNLCLYCGDGRHYVSSCPAMSRGRARSARVSEATLVPDDFQGNEPAQLQ
jgi:hypothetical protein